MWGTSWSNFKTLITLASLYNLLLVRTFCCILFRNGNEKMCKEVLNDFSYVIGDDQQMGFNLCVFLTLNYSVIYCVLSYGSILRALSSTAKKDKFDCQFPQTIDKENIYCLICFNYIIK